MKIELGPILYATPSTPTEWNFAIQVLVRGGGTGTPPIGITCVDPHVRVGPPEVAADFSDLGGRVFWRWPVRAARRATHRAIRYAVTAPDAAAVEGLPDGEIGPVVVPATGALPRFAFFSCNGVSSEKQFHNLKDPRALWRQMLQVHADAVRRPTVDFPTGYSLLVGGGDQIYADSLWDDEPLHSLGRLPEKERIRQKLYPGFAAAVETMFLELYVKRWSDPEMAAVLARVPGVFTWDDHDIFDGWGSHDEKLQQSPRYRAIFAAAARAFRAFQVGGDGAPALLGRGHFLQALGFHEADRHLDFLLLDLRSDRTRRQVMSQEQWRDLLAWLGGHAARRADGVRRHLVVVSTIPVVYMRFPSVIDQLGPLGDIGGIEDDRIDQWEHALHQGERARLLMQLLDHAARAGCQVTILSGDVHVAARARIVSTRPEHVPAGRNRSIIHQVTSSAIVNPPPSALELRAMTLISRDGRENLSDEVFTETVDVTGGGRYLRARNWLSGGVDEPAGGGGPARMWMQWMTEGGAVEPQVVVEP